MNPKDRPLVEILLTLGGGILLLIIVLLLVGCGDTGTQRQDEDFITPWTVYAQFPDVTVRCDLVTQMCVRDQR